MSEFNNKFKFGTPAGQPGFGGSYPFGQAPLYRSPFEQWRLATPSSCGNIVAPVPYIIAIGGGKGGVGKSLISANLAAHFASAGLRTLVVDLDFGAANLHTYFGLNQPKASLSDFLIDSQCDFFDLLSPTSVNNLALIAGGHEARWSREMDRVTAGIQKLWQPLLASRRQLGVDCVLLDLGAGSAEHTLQGFSLAHMGIMTVLAEPTSIENAYSFLKILFLKYVDQVAERTGAYVEAHKVVSKLAKIQTSGFDGGFLATCESLKEEFPEFMDSVLSALNVHKLGLIVNQSRDHKDEQLGASMEMICRRYFGFNAKFYGRLGIDESAWHALRQKKLLTSLHPQSTLARSLRSMSQVMLEVMTQQKEVAFGSPV